MTTTVSARATRASGTGDDNTPGHDNNGGNDDPAYGPGNPGARHKQDATAYAGRTASAAGNGDCGPCDGKVNWLVLKYLGSVSDARIEVAQKDGTLVFVGVVQPGETFEFFGADRNGTLGTETYLKVNGALNTSIHTSCSQPIYVGMVKGNFEIVVGSSLEGGLLAAADGTCDGSGGGDDDDDDATGDDDDDDAIGDDDDDDEGCLTDRVTIEAEFLLPEGYVPGDLTGEVVLEMATSAAFGWDAVMTWLAPDGGWQYQRGADPVDGVNLDLEKVQIDWSQDLCERGNTIRMEGDVEHGIFDDGSGVVTVEVLLPVIAGGDVGGVDVVVAEVEPGVWQYVNTNELERCVESCGGDDDDDGGDDDDDAGDDDDDGDDYDAAGDDDNTRGGR